MGSAALVIGMAGTALTGGALFWSVVVGVLGSIHPGVIMAVGTLSARPDPQVWYTSTAGNLDSAQLGRVRGRGAAGGDPSLAFLEWSVDPDSYDAGDAGDWARANPGLGIRIPLDYVERDRGRPTVRDRISSRPGISVSI